MRTVSWNQKQTRGRRRNPVLLIGLVFLAVSPGLFLYAYLTMSFLQQTEAWAYAKYIKQKALYEVNVFDCFVALRQEQQEINLFGPNACFDKYSRIIPRKESSYVRNKNGTLILSANQRTAGDVSTIDRETETSHITLQTFDSVTPMFFDISISNHYVLGARKFVLDLRGNGGGLIDPTLKIICMFVCGRDRTETILTVAHGNTDKETVYTVEKLRSMFVRADCIKLFEHQNGVPACAHTNILRKVPVVILVDKNTASASEILAGTLQEHEVLVVGERTYGKGVTQERTETNSYILRVTDGEFFLGTERRKLNGRGITPDRTVVDDPDTDRDEAFQTALMALESS